MRCKCVAGVLQCVAGCCNVLPKHVLQVCCRVLQGVAGVLQCGVMHDQDKMNLFKHAL